MRYYFKTEAQFSRLECRNHHATTIVFRNHLSLAIWAIPLFPCHGVLLEDALVVSKDDERFLIRRLAYGWIATEVGCQPL